jgi:hypothetical protein
VVAGEALGVQAVEGVGPGFAVRLAVPQHLVGDGAVEGIAMAQALLQPEAMMGGDAAGERDALGCARARRPRDLSWAG